MREIIKKVFYGTKEQATKSILDFYDTNGYCITHFLYFAPVEMEYIFEKDNTKHNKEYYQALMDGNFLLPDGIALKIFFALAIKYLKINKNGKYDNLNGTDFVPYFLEQIKTQPHEIIIYGAQEKSLQDATKKLSTQGMNIIYTQNGYSELKKENINFQENNIHIILVGRGIPRQEIRTLHHKSRIMQEKCLVFTVGGLLDFISGHEVRAPKFIRTLRLERLRRSLTYPKKNLKKTLKTFGLIRLFRKKIILKK